MVLDHYLHKLSPQRTGKNRSSWIEDTALQAPHNQLLLFRFYKLISDIRHPTPAPVPYMTLEQQSIFLPEDKRYIPDQQCLGWHRCEEFPK